MSHPLIDQFITFIYVQDLTRSTVFYEDVLGLKLWIDQTTCRVYKISSGGCIGLCQSSESSKGRTVLQPNNLILTFVTQHVDEFYVMFQAQGVSIEHPPQINEQYRIYHFFLKDPDGYLIEIQKFLHPTD